MSFYPYFLVLLQLKIRHSLIIIAEFDHMAVLDSLDDLPSFSVPVLHDLHLMQLPGQSLLGNCDPAYLDVLLSPVDQLNPQCCT